MDEYYILDDLKTEETKEDKNFSNIFLSKSLKENYKRASKIAKFNTSVLIIGARGTGKESFAEYIHKESGRKGRYETVNCAAYPDTLIDDLLFGHYKGAFTGAIKDKKGIFHFAENGTIFLDEIADCSPVTQAKLLRVLQTGDFMRLGSEEIEKVNNIRIIAATNIDIRLNSKTNSIRRDLFDRLGKHVFFMPTLDESSENEKIEIINHLLYITKKKYGLSQKSFSKEAIDILKEQNYPGNFRDINNIIESLLLESPNNEVNAKEVISNLEIRRPIENDFFIEAEPNTMDESNRLFIKKKYLLNGKNIKKTATALEISENTVRKYIR